MTKLNTFLSYILIVACFSAAAVCLSIAAAGICCNIAVVDIKTASVHDLPELYKETLPSIVNITGTVSTEEFYCSSGFIVNKDRGLIVIAGHSAQFNRSIQVRLVAGQIIDANILAIDRDNDIAILKVNSSILKQLDIPELKLSTDINPGEFICTIGHPFQHTNVLTLGIICRDLVYNRDDLYAKFPGGILISDIMVAGGSSGGPVLNLKGNVVAMVVGYIGDRRGNRFSILVTAKSIQNLLDSVDSIED